VKDTFFCAPLVNVERGKLSVISNKGLEAVWSLDFKTKELSFKGRCSFIFGAKRNGPNETGEVIYYVHRIQVTGAGWDGHRTTEINVYSPEWCISPFTLPHLRNRRASLFSEDAMFTFRGWGGKVDFHTLDGVGTGHINYSSRAAVSKMARYQCLVCMMCNEHMRRGRRDEGEVQRHQKG
jgi:hypothetical protein